MPRCIRAIDDKAQFQGRRCTMEPSHFIFLLGSASSYPFFYWLLGRISGNRPPQKSLSESNIDATREQFIVSLRREALQRIETRMRAALPEAPMYDKGRDPRGTLVTPEQLLKAKGLLQALFPSEVAAAFDEFVARLSSDCPPDPAEVEDLLQRLEACVSSRSLINERVDARQHPNVRSALAA